MLSMTMYAVSDVFQMHQIQHTASSFAAQMKRLMKGRAQMAELTYIRVGDYYIPNLALDPEPEKPPKTVGKYGSLRRTYLKQHRHDLWRELAGSGKLTAHLLDIDDTAQEWMDRMLPQLMETAGVTEELKARDQLAWVGLVNNCRARVEEIIFSDLIYV